MMSAFRPFCLAGFRPTALRWIACAALGAGGIAGCGPERVDPDAPAAPPPSYTGPEFMRTSIGSMTVVAGYRPTLVGGYGLVVDLEGTGSEIVPSGLRERLLNEMARMGLGRGDYSHLSPQRVLNSETSAVVMVEGVIPPGATAGLRFDVQVRPIPGTDVVSLQGGRLFTTELRVEGLNLNQPERGSIAKARGPLFVNPFAVESRTATDESSPGDPTPARILGGGWVTKDQPIGLRLNQPAYRRARAIENRINSRFPPASGDDQPMAVAQSPAFVRLNVLERFRDRPRRMLELVSALFVNPRASFNEQKARQMLQAVAEQPTEPRIAHAIAGWQAMGRTALPVLRAAYTHEVPAVALAALEAGARLGDRGTVDALAALAREGGADFRDRAAFLLGRVLREHPDFRRLTVILRDLLDADDGLVRFAAFDALAAVDDPAIRFRAFEQKFDLAMADSEKPMIYVTRQGRPRIVIFDPMLGFNRPLTFSRDWPNGERLLLRLDDGDDMLSVYHKPPRDGEGRTHQIAPTVANLIYLLAYEPGYQDTTPGLEMPYTKVVEVVHALTERDHVPAPLVLQPTGLRKTIDQARDQPTDQRPETSRPDGRGDTRFEPLNPREAGQQPTPPERMPDLPASGDGAGRPGTGNDVGPNTDGDDRTDTGNGNPFVPLQPEND